LTYIKVGNMAGNGTMLYAGQDLELLHFKI
jgi:hypothetical protein